MGVVLVLACALLALVAVLPFGVLAGSVVAPDPSPDAAPGAVTPVPASPPVEPGPRVDGGSPATPPLPSDGPAPATDPSAGPAALPSTLPTLTPAPTAPGTTPTPDPNATPSAAPTVSPVPSSLPTPIPSPSAGPLTYRATATAIHDSVVRTDGAVQVGDTLQLRAWATDVALAAPCRFRIVTEGGWLMDAHGRIDNGVCALDLTVPAPQGPRDPDHGRYRLDLCITVAISFADQTASGSTRSLAAGDRLQPGGTACYDGSTHGNPDVLDLSFDGTGTTGAFTSDPPILSWDIADWDLDYAPLRFNTPWSVRMPAWVGTCAPPSLNGSWQTALILAASSPGCQDWSLRLPGVLPGTMPWGGGPGDWDVEIIVDYGPVSEATERTIAYERVPYAPSDGIVESAFSLVFPADLAGARFVNVGSTWSPAFIVTAPDATDCWLSMAPDWANIHGALADGRCTFTFQQPVPAPWVSRQYSVWATAGPSGPSRGSFGGSVLSIPAPAPPSIAPATTDGQGTTMRAVAGDGQGMALTVEVLPSPTPLPSAVPTSQPSGPPPSPVATATAVTPPAAPSRAKGTTATAATPCQVTTYSPFVGSSGGSVPDATLTCPLPPGSYVLRARMVDAAGTVTEATTPLVVDASPSPTPQPTPSPTPMPTPSPYVETVPPNASVTTSPAPAELGAVTLGLTAGPDGATVTVAATTDPATSPAGTPWRVGAGAALVDLAVTGANGPFLVCFPAAAELRLWHREAGSWVDVTWQAIGEGGVVIPDGLVPSDHPGLLCAETMTLSPWALARPKLGTTTTIASLPGEDPVFGTPVAVGVTVAPAAATGTVELREGAVVLGSCTLTAGACTVTIDGLAAGTHAVDAAYGADATYLATTTDGSSVITVDPAPTELHLDASRRRQRQGRPIRFNVSLIVLLGSSTPEGKVTLRDGGLHKPVIGRCTLELGLCSVRTKRLSPGRHLVVGIFPTDTNHLGSTGTVTVRIGRR